MSRDLLDPKARTMLDEMEAADRPDANERPIEEAREGLENLFAELGPGPEVAGIEDSTFPGPAGEVPIRVIRGKGSGPERPLIVFFHGGGHAQGSLNTHESLCRGLANACRATLVSVEYRLAPEAKFPAAYEDSLAAAEWALAHAAELGADPGTVVLAGDSAGANLAAAVCATMPSPERIAAQVLIYPTSSFSRLRELFDEDFDGFFLSFAELEYFQDLYVPPGTDLDDPRLSPLAAADLSTMPPAILVTGQCDPIHPQSEALDAALRSAGVDSKLLVYPGMIHGFYGMTTLFDQAQDAFDDVGSELERIVGTGAEAAA